MSKRLVTNLLQIAVAASLVSAMSSCAVAPRLNTAIVPGAGALATSLGTPVGNLEVPSGAAHIKVPHRYQGDTSSCGPSSLWSVMTFHLGAGRVNFDNLDKSLRPTGHWNDSVGVMPGALADAAERYGLTATVTNHGTTNNLRKLIDHGIPAVILGEWTDGKDKDLHFVVVNGYEGNDDKTTRWFTTDSMVKNDVETVLTTKELKAFWAECSLYGYAIPYQTGIVNVAPKRLADYIPEDNRTVWVRFLDANLKSAEDVLRWLDNRSPDFGKMKV